MIGSKSVEFEPATCWMIQVYSATSTGTVQCFTGSNASLVPLNMIKKMIFFLGNEEFWLKSHTLHFSPLMKYEYCCLVFNLLFQENGTDNVFQFAKITPK